MWSMELKFQHHMGTFQLSSVQSLSRVRLFLTPWIAARQDSLSITNSPSSPKLMSIESVMPSSHLILCHSLLLLPPIPPSIRVFSSDSTFRMRWPKYWRFSFSISTSKEHPGVISQKLQIWSLSQTYYIRYAFNKIIKWVEWALMFETNCSYNGTRLQYSCLENPMDGGAWWAAVHRVAKSQKWLSDFSFTFHFHALEEEMATHSSILAWRIPGMEGPGGLLSMGSHRVGYDWSDLAAAAAALTIILILRKFLIF